MDNRIEYLTCKNFKFFYGCEEDETSNKLVLNRKNLLLYGENGSGKSSIYWALYTILQSSIKQEDNDVHKYFEANEVENLRNRFADDSEISSIGICFSDDKGRQRTWEISNLGVNTLRDEFVRKTLLSSDFINYKYLSKIYDFRNSQSIDLFPMFERDLLQFIDLGEAYKDEKDRLLDDKTLASDWWNNIITVPERLPHNKNIVSVSSNEYIRFRNQILPRFCELLKNYLNSITDQANRYLENDFHSPFRLKFDFSKLVCDYNKSIGVRAKDGKFYKPKLSFELKYVHSLLNEEKSKVLKPHTFLNEAKLTAIALSIRLAMLDSKLDSPNTGKIFVLDDLLVSLDMSNRDTVLDIILKKVNKYQLLILTHDRAFYNIAKLRIENSDSSLWVFKEMYCRQQNHNDVPVPIIVDPQSYLSCAYKYLYEFDYPASANYLRKECERILCYLLPQNLTHVSSDNGKTNPAPLERLIINFKKICGELSINFDFCKKLIEHKNILLNPLSHDNITSPIYRQELISCTGILKELNKFKKVIISNVDKNDRITLNPKDSNGDLWTYIVEPQEMFFKICDNIGIWHYNNPNSLFISRQKGIEPEEQLDNKNKLRAGIGQIYHYLKVDIDFKLIFNEIYDHNGNKI